MFLTAGESIASLCAGIDKFKLEMRTKHAELEANIDTKLERLDSWSQQQLIDLEAKMDLTADQQQRIAIRTSTGILESHVRDLQAELHSSVAESSESPAVQPAFRRCEIGRAHV